MFAGTYNITIQSANLTVNQVYNDLYVVVKAVQSMQLTSISKNCQNRPKWRDLLTVRVVDEQYLDVEVWDYLQDADIIGSCALPLQAAHEKKRVTENLKLLSNNQIVGTVQIGIEYHRDHLYASSTDSESNYNSNAAGQDSRTLQGDLQDEQKTVVLTPSQHHVQQQQQIQSSSSQQSSQQQQQLQQQQQQTQQVTPSQFVHAAQQQKLQPVQILGVPGNASLPVLPVAPGQAKTVFKQHANGVVAQPVHIHAPGGVQNQAPRFKAPPAPVNTLPVGVPPNQAVFAPGQVGPMQFGGQRVLMRGPVPASGAPAGAQQFFANGPRQFRPPF